MPVNVKTTATKPDGVQWFRLYRATQQELANLEDFDAWTMALPGFVSFKKTEISDLVTEETVVFQDTEAFTNYQRGRDAHATHIARRAYNVANNIKSVVEISVS